MKRRDLYELRVGFVMERALADLAERATDKVLAGALCTVSGTVAVCLSPEGEVTLEFPDYAHPDDIVVTVRRDGGMIPTYRAIRDNLVSEVEARKRGHA